jgi:CheY-like chemotaxis protein
MATPFRPKGDLTPMRLDDVLSLLGRNRDYLILALAVLVLVEGGIIVLWARRSTRLRFELQTVVASAEAARSAAEAAAAAAARSAGTYRVGQGRREREVYSVGGRTAAPEGSRWRSPGKPALVLPEEPAHLRRDTVAAEVSPPAMAAAKPEPLPDTAAPAPTAEAAPEDAQPPAEYVSPVVEQAAAWVLPDVAASQPTPAAAAPAANGWFPATPATNGNGNGAHPDPTTHGWSGSPVPVEPAADFAVISDPGDVPAARRWDAPAAPESPSLKILDSADVWTIPAPAISPPSALTIDPAMFDTNDDTFIDDLPTTGDILLVEDDVTIAKLYRVLLESRGYTVRHAGDGLEGLDKANEQRPDLVLLDIMMPRMNGIAFLQALRSGDMRDVRVVVLSNFMEKQLVDDAMSLGALEYMVKAQTRPEALVGALPHWLRGERAFTS